jgi:hypothetical protein
MLHNFQPQIVQMILPILFILEEGDDSVQVHKSINGGGRWIYVGSYPLSTYTYSVIFKDNMP